MTNSSHVCSCIICKKDFSHLGINTHYLRIHGSVEDKLLFKKHNIKNMDELINIYMKNPNLCENCGKHLQFSKKRNKYCSSSCSAIASNIFRDKSSYKSDTTKTATCILCDTKHIVPSKRNVKIFVCNICKIKLKDIDELYSKDKKIIYNTLCGPYSKTWIRSCKYCKQSFCTGKKGTRVCNLCKHLKWANNKDQYAFKFNVYHYPQLFDLDKLKKFGWVSFGGKRCKQKNFNGLSRDHKVSVSDAKVFGYDPYYISHPCNCELMPFYRNSSKHSKSSITYQELVLIVNNFDTIYEVSSGIQNR